MSLVRRVKLVGDSQLWLCLRCKEHKSRGSFSFRRGRPLSQCRACKSAENRHYRVAHGQIGDRRGRPSHRKRAGANGAVLWRCARCKWHLPERSFTSRSNGAPDSYCRKCAAIQRRASAERRYVENAKRLREDIEFFLKDRVNAAQLRARDVGRSFEIDWKHLVALIEKQDSRCYWTGEHMTFSAPGAPTTISIDRIQSSFGYTKENVVLCCIRANRMKADDTPSDFVWWCRRVVERHKSI